MIRKIWKIILIFLLVIFCSIIVCRKIFFSYKTLKVVYNHDFPVNSFYTESGDRVYITNNFKYKVIFYLSDSCEACINRLNDIGKITRIFKSDNIEYIILWENKIPKNRLKGANVDIGICYSLKNQVSLSKLKPEEFILDKNNKVYYISSQEQNKLVDVICTLDEFNNLKERAAEEIIISNLTRGTIDLEKDTLAFFSSDACESCKEAEKFIYSNNIDNEVNIIKISRSLNSQEYIYVDYYNIYSIIYKINCYPTFLLIDRDTYNVEVYNDINEIIKLIS